MGHTARAAPRLYVGKPSARESLVATGPGCDSVARRMRTLIGPVVVWALLGGCSIENTRQQGDHCLMDRECASGLRCEVTASGVGRCVAPVRLDVPAVPVDAVVDAPAADAPDAPAHDGSAPDVASLDVARDVPVDAAVDVPADRAPQDAAVDAVEVADAVEVIDASSERPDAS